MSNGHNGYLDILLDMGAGASPLRRLGAVSGRVRAFSLGELDWASLAGAFLLMALIYNAAESSLNSLAEHMTAVVILASMVIPHERRDKTITCPSACAATGGTRCWLG